MSAANLITFDEATHTYTVNGRRVPGVTEVLKPLYGDLAFVREDLLQYKSELGSAVHKAVELHVLDGLVYSSLSGPVAEYFEQYLVFEAETNFKATATEFQVHNPIGYCGTVDLAGQLGSSSWVIDVKTTAALSPAVALQTVAYLQAYNAMGDTGADRRAALRLTPTSYRLEAYKTARDAMDYSAFVGLLKIKQWAAANGCEISEIQS